MSDEDPYKIEDSSILTFVEHRLIGSSVDRADMIRNPFKPQAVLDGRRPIEVAVERITRREIKSADAEAFGLPARKLPLVALNMMSTKSGDVIDKKLRLTGIFDLVTEEVERDPVVLSKYSLSTEGKKKYLVEGEAGRREKIG